MPAAITATPFDDLDIEFMGEDFEKETYYPAGDDILVPDDRDAEEAHQGNWEAASGKRRNKKKRGGPGEADAMSDVDAEVAEALKTKQRLCPEATNVSAS